MTHSKAHKAQRLTAFPILKVNTLLDGVVHRLRSLGLPPLGPDLSGLSGTDLADALVVHRFLKKYEVPKAGNVEVRRDASIRKVLDRDALGFDLVIDQVGFDGAPRVLRTKGLKARYIISTFCEYFQKTYTLVFPTGETSTSSRGEKDLYFKLENDRYWECSSGSFGYVCRIFYKNPHMKRLVKKKYYARVFTEFGWSRTTSAQKLYARHGKNGFAAFRTMMSSLVTLRDTSRMTTVRKDNDSDRVITCEPFLTMIAQLSYMRDMRRALQRATGLDLRHLQDWHGTRVRCADTATIDLKNASNQVWLDTVRWLFPHSMTQDLMSLRTGVCEVDGTYHHFNMFSPMGCGLTFDVMTWILLACARAYDESASVFGDDVLIRGSAAGSFIHLIECFGFQVNTQKSFIDGNFRESCGHFGDVSTNQLICCFDFERPTDAPSTFTILNKLSVILEAGQLGPALDRILRTLRDQLLTLMPRDAFLVCRSSHVSSEYVVVTDDSLVEKWWSSDWQCMVYRHTRYQLVKPVYRGALSRTPLDTVRMLRLLDNPTLGSEKARLRLSKSIVAL